MNALGQGAVDVTNEGGSSPFVLVCDHASNFIPAEYGDMGLTAAERDWLNAYHTRVAEVLVPELEGADRDWLLEKCAAI